MDTEEQPQTSFKVRDIYEVELTTAGLVADVYVHTQCNQQC